MKKLLLVIGLLLACAQAHAQKIDVYQPFGPLATITPGTGVATALGVNVGSNGSILLNGGQVSGNIVVGSSGTTALNSLAYGANGGISLSGGGTPSYGSCYWNDTDTCTTENVRVRERIFVGNAVLATDVRANPCAATWDGGLDVQDQWQCRDGQLVVMTDRGTIAISGMSKSSQSDALGASTSAIGVSAFTLNDTTVANKSAWGMYSEITHNPTANAWSFGLEIDTRNASSTNATGDPYAFSSDGAVDIWLGAGTGSGSLNPSLAAVAIVNNGQPFNTGIIFKDGSLTKDTNGNSIALALGSNAGIEWYTAAGTPAGILTSNAAGRFVLGGADSATPIAQSISAQSALAGQSNISSGDFTINGSRSTGTGNGGAVWVSTASAGGSGTTQNALNNRGGITQGGKWLIGSTKTVATAEDGTTTQPILQILNASGTLGNTGELIAQYAASSTTPSTLYLALSKTGTINAQVAVASGDQLGRVIGVGSDGTNFANSSAVQFEVDGNVSAGIVPGRIILKTQAATGANTLVEALRIDSAQKITVASLASAGTQCVQASSAGLLAGNGSPCGNTPGGTTFISGAIGDFQQQSGGVTTASSTTLTAGTSNCNSGTDPTKSILIPGAGANGAILETTIASCSGNNFVLTAAATLAASSSIYQASPSLFTLIAPGSGYVPGDTFTLTGGTAAVNASGTVVTTQVASASVNAAGSGGTNGICVVTGTTGVGVAGALGPGQNKIAPNAIAGGLLRAHVTVVAGAISAINDFITGGNYTTNPTSLTAEPVTGCGLTGATLTITMGIATITLTNPGSYTVQAASPVAQGSTSGAGTGATFGVYWLAGGHYYYGTNNLTVIQAALTAADTAGGGIVQLPCGGTTGTNNKYLVTGGNLTVGDGTNLIKVGLTACINSGVGGAAGNFVGASSGGLWFDPTGGNKIFVFSNSALQGITIFNPTVPFAPLPATYRTSADVMAAYNGTAVQYGNNGGGRGGQSYASNVTIFGYGIGWQSSLNGQLVWEKLRFDAVNGMKISNIPDWTVVRDAECYTWGTNQSSAPASISISTIQNDGSGHIQLTLASAQPYQTGDRIDVTAAGSLPNLAVTGYSAANGSWIVGTVSGNNVTLAGSTFNASQTYVSGGGVIWDQSRPGSCLYFDASIAGDGMTFEHANWVFWQNGIYINSGQATRIVAPGDGGNPAYASKAYSIWFDGTINHYDIEYGEFQQSTIPILDTSSTTTNQAPGQIHGTLMPSNGMGYTIAHLGSLPMLVSGTATYSGNLIYLGDNSGLLQIASSNMQKTAFLAQSGADWANLAVGPDTQLGTQLAYTGAASVVPPYGTTGAQISPGVCDVSAQTNVVCYGLRRELSSYSGPLVNVTRASDSTTLDLTQDQFGNLDQAKCAAFQGSSTLSVNKWYDQRNGINAVQATGANQPALQCSVPAFGGRPGILYTVGQTQSLTTPSSATWQGAFSGAVSGTLLATAMPVSVASTNDRLYEMNGGGGTNSIAITLQNGGTTLSVNTGYSSTIGTFTAAGSLSTTVPTVLDWQYQWTATTNVPTFTYNGTPQSLSTTTAGTGTAGTDTGQVFSIGGIGSAASTWPGYINTFAIWKAGPPAAQLEQARKVEGAYYGVTVQ